MTDNSSIDLSLTNVWRAWMTFRRGKQPSRDIRSFELELEYNLLRLCSDLNTGQYEHGGYHHRIVNEKKRRDIAVASVRDRVVHRLLYDYLVPIVDPRLDYDVWSCRQNKGLHKALQRTHDLLHDYSHGWVWRADISKFFDHIEHGVLKQGLARFSSDELAQNLLDKVLESYIHNGDRQTGRQADRQTDRQTDRQADTARHSNWQFDESNFCKYLS